MNTNGASAEPFRLRPRLPQPEDISRVYETTEPIAIPRSSQPPEEDETSSLSSLSTLPRLRSVSIAPFARETPFTVLTSPDMAITRSETKSASSAKDTRSESQEKDPKEVPQRMASSSPETGPSDSTENTTANKTRKANRRATTPPDNYPPILYKPTEKGDEAFWKKACRAARRDGKGKVKLFDVVNWMGNRKGGYNLDWPQLREAKAAIATMRKGTIDLDKIHRKIAEEESEKQSKEERRLANKRRYQPRSAWAKEKAAQQAAVSLKRSRDDGDGKNDGVEALPMDGGEPVAKRSRIDATNEPSSIVVAYLAPGSIERSQGVAEAEDNSQKSSPEAATSLKRPRDGKDLVENREAADKVDEKAVEPTAKRLRVDAENQLSSI
ncbi:Fc.00g017860.m01.CDS01 [Cosmosporella sp. VM-42]